MKKLSEILILALALLMVAGSNSYAQESSDDTESFFNKQEDEASKEPTVQDKKTQPEVGVKGAKVKEISDLGKLAAFKDIAVIQKRFLPKTHRFEAFGAIGSTLNDAFFVDATLNLRIGYYFQERYGIELSAMAINASTRKVTDSLADRGVTTASLVSPKSYLGIDFKYTPVYGKMAMNNKRLTPFDMYFSVGGGSTTTSSGSSPTLHLGTGQIFAMSNGFALRWDFSWNFYQATTYLDAARTTSSTSMFNNLFVLLGASFFFPEATYR